MIKIFTRIPGLLISSLILLTNISRAQSLHAFMRNCAFFSAGSDTSYVETYISVPGFELNYVRNNSGNFEGALNIALDYFKDSSIVTSDHYTLRTPEIADTTNISFNVLDLRRELLPRGDYNIRLRVIDANSPSGRDSLSQETKVSFNRSKIALSDIEFIQEYSATTSRNLYSKNGYDIHPLAISFFPNALSRLRFYNEIYNASSSGEDIVIMYSIKDAQSGDVADDLFRFTRQKAEAVNYLFSEFDISDLPTGNYILEVQVKNKKNELIGQQSAFFQRINQNSVYELSNISLININNKFVNAIPADSMPYYLSAILPKAELFERDYINNLKQRKDSLLMKTVFLQLLAAPE